MLDEAAWRIVTTNYLRNVALDVKSRLITAQGLAKCSQQIVFVPVAARVLREAQVHIANELTQLDNTRARLLEFPCESPEPICNVTERPTAAEQVSDSPSCLNLDATGSI